MDTAIGNLVLSCTLLSIGDRNRVILAGGTKVCLKRVVGDTLIDRSVLTIAGTISEVLIGTFCTVVIVIMTSDTIRNGILETDGGVVYWVLGDIEHIITLCANQSSIDIQVCWVDSGAVGNSVKTLLGTCIILVVRLALAAVISTRAIHKTSSNVAIGPGRARRCSIGHIVAGGTESAGFDCGSLTVLDTVGQLIGDSNGCALSTCTIRVVSLLADTTHRVRAIL